MSYSPDCNNNQTCKTSQACNHVCEIMKNAGVPNDIKWRALINFLRTIDQNKRFNTQQKRELQLLLQEIVLSKSYSDEDYNNIMNHIDNIQFSDLNILRWYSASLADIQDKYKALKKVMDDILSAYASTTLQALQNSQDHMSDVSSLRNSTTSSLSQNVDKSLIISNIIKTAENIISKIDKEISDWKLKNEESLKWKQIATNMELLATTDMLTQVYNRRALDSYLPNIITATYHSHSKLSLILIDVDNFKTINDTYGHTTGDEVLRLVASIIKKSIKTDNCFIARYGGEEFTIVCENTDIETAYKLAETIRKNIASYPFKIRHSISTDEVIHFTASLGVSEITLCNIISKNNGNISQQDAIQYSIKLINSADKALYSAKRSGKNMTVISLDCSKDTHTSNTPNTA